MNASPGDQLRAIYRTARARPLEVGFQTEYRHKKQRPDRRNCPEEHSF